MSQVARRLTRIGWLALLSVFPMACTLFDAGYESVFEHETRLPPIPRALDALELEIVYIDSPLDDPLLRTTLWNEVDQISNLGPETRAMLRQNGIRFGHISSTPPRPLQTLWKVAEESKRLSRQRFFLPGGANTTIETSPVFAERVVAIHRADGDEVQTYRNARCVLKVTGERLQDGWARLDFLPEIHHSERVLRPVAAETQFALRTAQDVAPLYAQQFSMKLSAGDIVLLTVDRESSQFAGSIGQHFFLGANGEKRMQRLMLIRLAQMEQIDPAYQ